MAHRDSHHGVETSARYGKVSPGGQPKDADMIGTLSPDGAETKSGVSLSAWHSFPGLRATLHPGYRLPVRMPVKQQAKSRTISAQIRDAQFLVLPHGIGKVAQPHCAVSEIFDARFAAELADRARKVSP